MENQLHNRIPNKQKTRVAEKDDPGPLAGHFLQLEIGHSGGDASIDGTYNNTKDDTRQEQRFCTVSSDSPVDGKRELVTNVTQMKDKASKNENGVSEDLNKAWTGCGPEACQKDQEDKLSKDVDDNVPSIKEQIKKGKMVLLYKNPSGSLQVQSFRSFSPGVSCVNKVVVPQSAEAKSDAMEALLTHALIRKELNLPKGVVFDSSKVGQELGEYRAGYEYEVEAKLGKGSHGEVTRIRDKKLSTLSARKKIPVSDFRPEEVRAPYLLLRTGVSSDPYAAVIEEDHVNIFSEEIKGIQLSTIVAEINRSERLKSLFLQNRAKFMQYLPYAVLKAVFCLHDKRVCHRDLNWGNIFLDFHANSSVRIVDYGDSECNQEELEVVQQEYHDVCLHCLDLFHADDFSYYPTSLSEDNLPKLENGNDKNARNEIVNLITKVSNIKSFQDVAVFRQLIEQRYNKVLALEDTMKAVQNFCSEVAGFHDTHDVMSLKKDVPSDFDDVDQTTCVDDNIDEMMSSISLGSTDQHGAN